MKILIVGGGIGGLTAACALAGAGHEMEVVDRRARWDIAGWGLSLTGPALRAMKAIGIAERCVQEGYGITEIATWSADGELERTFAPPRVAGQDFPAQAGIMRTVLHNILLDRAAELGVVPRLDEALIGLDQDEDGVAVRFVDGRTARYDLVVGADGVGSATRTAIGIKNISHYLGQVTWRALVDRPDWCDKLCTFAGEDQLIGLIPISSDMAYIWIMEPVEGDKSPADDDLPAAMRELLKSFGGRIEPIRKSITNPSQIVRRRIDVHLVNEPWFLNRVVLIGDAVHAPSPQLVTGAALAIEDGVILAEVLDEVDVPTSLATFFERRFGRCRLVHEACVSISKLQLAGNTPAWTRVQAEAFAALAAPA